MAGNALANAWMSAGALATGSRGNSKVLNTSVFRHRGISWEWGIVFIAAFLFILGIEAWKWAKRIYFRRRARKRSGGLVDLETRVFGHYFSAGDEDATDVEMGTGPAERQKQSNPASPSSSGSADNQKEAGL